MKTNSVLIFILGLAVGWLVNSVMMTPKSTTMETASGTVMITGDITPKKFELYQNMRKLWEDHVTWTRLVIVGITGNVPGTNEATIRLLGNAKDMAVAITPYYGQAAADKFQTLMEDHLKIAAKLVTEAKSGNKNATQTEADWYKNADDIANFLSEANPNWPKDDVKNMLYEHLEWTKKEAVARLEKKYADEIEIYDTIHGQALMMADTLSQGTIMQFPDNF